MRVRASLLLAVILAVFASAPAATSATTSRPLDAKLFHLAADKLGHEHPARVVRWLRRQPAVRSASLGPDRRTVEIQFRDGSETFILPSTLSTVRVPLPTGIARRQVHALARPRQSVAPRAVVLEPFASELGLGPNAGDIEVNDLQQAGFKVDQGYDQSVTVNTMASLSQYNVVYMHTHTGPAGNGDGVVATGQIDPSCPAVPAQYQAEGVVCVGVYGDTQNGYFAITSGFVSSAMGTFPRDSMLYFNGCELLGSTIFWQALASKGAGVMVSWNNWSATYDDYLSAAAFYNVMDQGSTVQNAIATLQANGYGTSNTQQGPSKMGYLGDGTITLARSAAGGGGTHPPTATPQPTQTSVPTTVASPTPTATSRPGATATPTSSPTHIVVPLQVAGIHSRVAGGSQQDIDVHTAASAGVDLTVTYPNGDVLQSSRSADGAGNASFSYRQPRSTITRHQQTAQVRVEAHVGTAVATASATYIVGFSKLDVSTTPRRAAPRQMVTVWVHTRARTAVKGTASVPGVKARALHGKTGKHGWAHIHYRVSSHATPGETVRIAFAVKLSHGKKVYHAATTLTVE